MVRETQPDSRDGQKPDPFYDLIMNEDLAANRWPKEIDEQRKNNKHSLMADVISKEMFDKLKDLKSETGWTIARAINTGVLCPSSFVGCHAGDLNSYHLFKDFFFPVIETYHKGYKLDGTMKHITDMNPAMVKETLTDAARNQTVTTRIRCARNLAMFPLNTAGTLQTRLQIADLMEKVFNEINTNEEFKNLAGSFIRHSTMTPEQEQMLIADHFLFKGKDKMQAASGYHQFWPKGRGIFLSADKRFVVWVNEGDHIRIICLEEGGDVLKTLVNFNRAVTTIERILKKITGRDEVFMCDPILGMITCCPTNLGTGMRASVHIRVPKLINKLGLEKMEELAKSLHCQVRGTSGEHSEIIDRVDVSNSRRLGVPEYELIQDMVKCINELARLEEETPDA